MNDIVLQKLESGLLTITMNRPERRNALNVDMTQGLVAAARRAATDAVQLLADRGKGTGGLILLDRSGTPAFAFNTPRMAYAYVNPDGTFVTSL